MIDSLGFRVLEGLAHHVSLVIPQVRVRFQLAPGTAPDLGISGAAYEVVVNGAVALSGTTDANGEVVIPQPLVATGNCSLRIFGTEYPLALENSWDAVTTRKGRQQRFNHLGYIQGHLLDATVEPAADGNPASRYNHAINNFQWDQNLAADGAAGTNTQNKLTTVAGV